MWHLITDTMKSIPEAVADDNDRQRGHVPAFAHEKIAGASARTIK